MNLLYSFFTYCHNCVTFHDLKFFFIEQYFLELNKLTCEDKMLIENMWEGKRLAITPIKEFSNTNVKRRTTESCEQPLRLIVDDEVACFLWLSVYIEDWLLAALLTASAAAMYGALLVCGLCTRVVNTLN